MGNTERPRELVPARLWLAVSPWGPVKEPGWHRECCSAARGASPAGAAAGSSAGGAARWHPQPANASAAASPAHLTSVVYRDRGEAAAGAARREARLAMCGGELKGRAGSARVSIGRPSAPTSASGHRAPKPPARWAHRPRRRTDRDRSGGTWADSFMIPLCSSPHWQGALLFARHPQCNRIGENRSFHFRRANFELKAKHVLQHLPGLGKGENRAFQF